jgi:flavin reductase (DIM6/NTAB) family NADH-FMN oxidoreductase RutF
MNQNFSEIKVKTLEGNLFKMLDIEWMLITAGKMESFNTMTASWGTFGILWSKPVAIAFIRPQRYTLGFVEKNDLFTLSFFPDKYKKALSYCGQVSGKDVDKIKQTGLKPFATESGAISFEQSKLFFECRKLYTDNFKPENFIDKSIVNSIYPTKDFHKLFIGEITRCYISDDEQ